MRKNLVIVFPLYLFLCSFTWEIIDKSLVTKKFEEMNSQLKALQNYSIVVSHFSYESFVSTVAHEKSTGYFKRANNNYHSFLMGIHTIQNQMCKLVIDSIHNTIFISDPDLSWQQTFTQADYLALMNLSTSVLKNQVGDKIGYRLEFSEKHPLNAYEILLNSKGLPEKISIYFNREIKMQDNSITKPRMEIVLKDWNKNAAFSKDEFDENKYFQKKGDKYFLKAPFANNYKLIDQRVKAKQKR